MKITRDEIREWAKRALENDQKPFEIPGWLPRDGHEINTKLVSALEAVEHLVSTEYREGNGMVVMQQVRTALAEARGTTSPSSDESSPTES